MSRRIMLNGTSYFGQGAIQEIVNEIKNRHFKKVLVTSTPDLFEFKVATKVTDLLDAAGIAYDVYDNIKPNPTIENVTSGVAACKAAGADVIVAVGGGSAIDTSKAIATIMTNPEFSDVRSLEGLAPTKHPCLPIIAVSTTSGTAAEVTINYVITDVEKKRKFVCVDTHDIPVVAVVDPEMMLTIPAHLTAYQGFDALFHATEGYIANVATPLSDAYALKSIELLAKYLPAAVKDGSDLEARTQVALASTLSGMVESTSCCTSEHGMEHALSAFYPKLPHGAGLIMLSEAYYSFFADKSPERFTAMAKAMGVVTGHLPEAERPMAFVKALVELQKACGVDGLKMSDYGITKEDMAKCAANARHTMGGLFELDPYALSLDETTQIMMNAFK